MPQENKLLNTSSSTSSDSNVDQIIITALGGGSLPSQQEQGPTRLRGQSRSPSNINASTSSSSRSAGSRERANTAGGEQNHGGSSSTSSSSVILDGLPSHYMDGLGDYSFRCKLYEFDADDNTGRQEWKDLGTGYVFADLREAKRRPFFRRQNNAPEGGGPPPCSRGVLQVHSDTLPPRLIKEFLILPPASYILQGDQSSNASDDEQSQGSVSSSKDTIIVWEDFHTGYDYALSLEKATDAAPLYEALNNQNWQSPSMCIGNPIGNISSLPHDRRMQLQHALQKPRRKVLPDKLDDDSLEVASQVIATLATNFISRQQLAGKLNAQGGLNVCPQVLEIGGITVNNRRLCSQECGETSWFADLHQMAAEAEELELEEQKSSGTTLSANSSPQKQKNPPPTNAITGELILTPSEHKKRLLFEIVRNMFTLADQNLVKAMLDAKHWETILWIMEWDPGLSRKVNHRQVLKRVVRYRRVVNFANDETLKLIDLNFRVQYIRDVAMARLLDDVNTNVLNHIVGQNLTSLIECIQEGKGVLRALFDQLDNKDWLALDFVAESLRTLRYQNIGVFHSEKDRLYTCYERERLFKYLLPFIVEPDTPETSDIQHLPDDLEEDDVNDLVDDFPVRRTPHPTTRTVALDILQLYAFHNPSLLRNYAISNPDWLKKVASILLVESDQPTQSLVSEVLRWTLDFDAAHNPQLFMMLQAESSHLTGIQKIGVSEREGFLEIVWERQHGVMLPLVTALRDATMFDPGMTDEAKNFARQCILDILATGVQKSSCGQGKSKHDLYHVVVFLVTTQAVEKAAKLLNVPCKFLHITVIKFIRTAIEKKNDQLIRAIMKTPDTVFGPVFRILKEQLAPLQKQNRMTGNSLLSAILALLSQISDPSSNSSQSIRELVKFIFAHFMDVFTEPFCNTENPAAGCGIYSSFSANGAGRDYTPRNPLELGVLTKLFWSWKAILKAEEDKVKQEKELEQQALLGRNNRFNNGPRGFGTQGKGGKTVTNYEVPDSWFEDYSDSEEELSSDDENPGPMPPKGLGPGGAITSLFPKNEIGPSARGGLGLGPGGKLGPVRDQRILSVEQFVKDRRMTQDDDADEDAEANQAIAMVLGGPDPPRPAVQTGLAPPPPPPSSNEQGNYISGANGGNTGVLEGPRPQGPPGPLAQPGADGEQLKKDGVDTSSNTSSNMIGPEAPPSVSGAYSSTTSALPSSISSTTSTTNTASTTSSPFVPNTTSYNKPPSGTSTRALLAQFTSRTQSPAISRPGEFRPGQRLSDIAYGPSRPGARDHDYRTSHTLNEQVGGSTGSTSGGVRSASTRGPTKDAQSGAGNPLHLASPLGSIGHPEEQPSPPTLPIGGARKRSMIESSSSGVDLDDDPLTHQSAQRIKRVTPDTGQEQSSHASTILEEIKEGQGEGGPELQGVVAGSNTTGASSGEEETTSQTTSIMGTGAATSTSSMSSILDALQKQANSSGSASLASVLDLVSPEQKNGTTIHEADPPTTSEAAGTTGGTRKSLGGGEDTTSPVSPKDTVVTAPTSATKNLQSQELQQEQKQTATTTTSSTTTSSRTGSKAKSIYDEYDSDLDSEDDEDKSKNKDKNDINVVNQDKKPKPPTAGPATGPPSAATAGASASPETTSATTTTTSATRDQVDREGSQERGENDRSKRLRTE
ncbi:unnamed protein product [Amoebophrya sp. A25]|nr:unnamed protein product [Amoebophrya sp. A25]|eukprot:GSA25T00012920001.1